MFINDINKSQYPLITQTVSYNVEMMNLSLTNRSTKSGNYIIKDRKDNWQQFNYIDHRWLDAAGAVFNIHPPCSSVSYSDSTLFISYNTYPNLMTSRLVPEIFSYFKNNTIPDLLPYYLLFNHDFHGEFKYYATIYKNIDVAYKALLSFSKPLKIFYVAKDQYSNNSLKLINLSIKDIFNNNYLKANFEAYVNTLEGISNSIPLKPKEKVIQELKNIFFNFSTEIYKFILNEIIEGDANDASLKETMIRPLQDICKLNYVFQLKDNTELGQLRYEILPNPHNIHTEVNNYMYIMPPASQEQVYMGIPKLCCALCDIVLTESSVLHRGSHGIYDKWETSGGGRLAKIKESIDKRTLGGEYKTVEVGGMPVLTRSLSTDSFEQDIEEFWKTKQTLGLTIDLMEMMDNTLDVMLAKSNVVGVITPEPEVNSGGDILIESPEFG